MLTQEQIDTAIQDIERLQAECTALERERDTLAGALGTTLAERDAIKEAALKLCYWLDEVDWTMPPDGPSELIAAVRKAAGLAREGE